MKSRLASFIAAFLVVSASVLPGARADEVRVLAAGAVKRALGALVGPFEARGQHTVAVHFDTVGALRDRVLTGEAPDLVILSDTALTLLADRGKLWNGTRHTLGKTSVGICIAATAPSVDISTPEKLRAVLLAAASIAHADPKRGATAGTHFRRVLAKLGIEAELSSRVTVVPFGAGIAGDVADGKFALGASQMSEIVVDSRVRGYALPEPYALQTGYGVGLVKAPGEGARAFVAWLRGETGRAALATAGFAP